MTKTTGLPKPSLARRRALLQRLNDFTWLHSLDRSITLDPSYPLVGYDRVSTRRQEANGTLNRRKEFLNVELRSYGYKLHETFVEEAHGFTMQRGISCKDERGRLIAAIKLARKLGGGVVTPSVCRFIRPEFVKDHVKQKAPQTIQERLERIPSQEEFDELLAWADGVPLITVIEPDAPETAINKREQQFKIKPKSRGHRYTEQFKATLMPSLILNDQMKLKPRDMELLHNVSHTTINKWLNEAKKSGYKNL